MFVFQIPKDYNYYPYLALFKFFILALAVCKYPWSFGQSAALKWVRTLVTLVHSLSDQYPLEKY